MSNTPSLYYLLLAPQNEHSQVLSDLIADGLRPNGIVPLPTTASDKPATASVRRAIEQADFVIADLSANNPNVMYEVGYAHGIGKLVLPIMGLQTERVPADLTGYQYVVYDPSKPAELVKHIRNWAVHSPIRQLQRS